MPLVHIPKDARVGKEPCGECHLPDGEPCDICGARRPPAQTISADKIAMVLAEELIVEGGRISNIAYVAVKLAEMAERGDLKPL